MQKQKDRKARKADRKANREQQGTQVNAKATRKVRAVRVKRYDADGELIEEDESQFKKVGRPACRAECVGVKDGRLADRPFFCDVKLTSRSRFDRDRALHRGVAGRSAAV